MSIEGDQIMTPRLRITRPTHLRKILQENDCIETYSIPYEKLTVKVAGETDAFLAINRKHEAKFNKYLKHAKEYASEFTETTKNI